MKTNRTASMLAAMTCAALFAVSGCNPPPAGDGKGGTAAGTKEAHGHDHDHGHAGHDHDHHHHDHAPGPNGGVVFDFGSRHAEFTVDHEKKECTVLFLGADEKSPGPVAAKELILSIRKSKTKDGKETPPMTITLVPKDEAGGKAAKFVGTDPGLGNVADFAGDVSTEIDGKPASGEFKE